MTIQRADARFVLSHPVDSVAVLGPREGWEQALAMAGVPITGVDSGPDLVVASTGAAGEALASGARSVLVEGRVRARPAPADPPRRRLLTLPSLDEPRLIVPLDQRASLRYALGVLARPKAAWKRARNLVLRGLVAAGLQPPGLPTATVATTEPGPPSFVAAARDLGVPSDVGWVLALGANPMSRSAFLLFRPGDADPSWALKFSRVPGQTAPFDDDEQGLGAARAAGGRVAAVAPLLVGRFAVGDLDASLETAAAGRPLFDELSTGRRSTGLAAVERVAEWTVEVGVQTRAAPSTLEAERARLASEVVPRWTSRGAPSDLVDRTLDVPAVFGHGDLWPLNVIGSGSDFSLIDWENARPHSLPLWDLCFFLTDAATVVEQIPAEERDDYVVGLWRGEEALSELLFRWLRRAVDAIGVPERAVAPVITLMWLGHGLSSIDRREALAHPPEPATPQQSPAERLAARWLVEPGLGPSWDRWLR